MRAVFQFDPIRSCVLAFHENMYLCMVKYIRILENKFISHHKGSMALFFPVLIFQGRDDSNWGDWEPWGNCANRYGNCGVGKRSRYREYRGYFINHISKLSSHWQI